MKKYQAYATKLKPNYKAVQKLRKRPITKTLLLSSQALAAEAAAAKKN